MSIQSVDNFQINVAKPIDSRMVTSGTVSRTNLAYKYEGLRVYDTENKAPYVWIGGAWKQESSSSSGSGSGSGSGSISSGTADRVIKYTTSDTIGNSTIVDRSTGFNQPGSTNVGIGRNPNSGYALDVNGKVRGSIFEMSNNTLEGGYLKDLSVNNEKIKPHTISGYVLKTVGSSVIWVEDINTTLVVKNKTDIADTHYLLFTDVTNNTTGNNVFANNGTTRLIGVKPSTSQILGSSDSTTNDKGTPAYSFSGTTDAGLYGNSAEIGLSFAGKALLKLNSTTISLSDTSGNTVLSTGTGLVNFGTGAIIKSQATSLVTSPDYTWTGDLTTGMYRPATNQVALTTNGVARFTVTNTMSTISTPTTLSSTLAVTGATTLSDKLDVVTGKATSLGGTLTVSGLTTINNKLVVVSSGDAIDLTNNGGLGIKFKTDGEFIRSIQNPSSDPGYNFMSFYKTDTADTSGRKGLIGYANKDNNDLYVSNGAMSGTIILATTGVERVNINYDGLTLKNISDNDVSIDTILSGQNSSGIFNIKSNGVTKMRINSGSISVDTPLRISGASFVLGNDTDNYFGFVQGGAGIYGFTHELDTDPQIKGTVGLRIKGAWATKAIDISNTEIKSFLTHKMEKELNATKGLKYQKVLDFSLGSTFGGISHAGSRTWTHDLGYIPMVTITTDYTGIGGNNEDVGPVIRDLTTTSITITNYCADSHHTIYGKVYLW